MIQIAANASCPAPMPAGPAEYRAITEEQTQCLASSHSSRANYLETEADRLDQRSACGAMEVFRHTEKDRDLKRQVLHYTALEDRNQSAGQALEQYFRLAESEGKADLLRFGLAELERTIKDITVLKVRGVKLPEGMESLEDQNLQMAADLARLENAITSRNDSLVRLTGLEECGRCWRLRPVLDTNPLPPPPDPASAVALARQTRPSLQLSRILEQESDADTLSAMKLFLQLATGVPGIPERTGPLGKLCGAKRREFAARKTEVDQLSGEADRLVEAEVCQALRNLQAQAGLVCLARERLAGQLGKVRDLQDRVARKVLSEVHLLAPRLQASRLEADLFHEIAEWHIARIKLKQAQGLLVVECQTSEHACSPHAMRASGCAVRWAPPAPSDGGPAPGPAVSPGADGSHLLKKPLTDG